MDFEQCQRMYSHLRGQAVLREAMWRELSTWICPWRGVFSGVWRDAYAGESILRFTHTAGQAALRGASGMTSGMTPRNVSWFRPTFDEPELLEASGARQWLDALDARMQDALASGGFYQAIQNFNLDLIWSGCALLYTEKDDPLRFECVQVGSFCMAVGLDNALDAVGRELELTVSECARVFGEDRLSEQSRRKLRDAPWDTVRIIHLCRRTENDSRWPVRSWWWEEGGKQFLRAAGFYEMPYFHAIWNEGSTPYGMGPGDQCIADARQMDMLERHKLSGLAKLANPPVTCPPEFKDALDLDAGGINYTANPGAKILPILDLSPYASSIARIQDEIQIVARRLEQGLMASIFASMPLDQRPNGMSATEFVERKREALQQLGPVISAYEPTVLTPLLFRLANTLDRAGLTPPVPEALQNVPLYMKIDFISPMANALRQTGAETARALFQDVTAISQGSANPAVFDKIDTDQLVDELATGLGVPGGIVRSDDDVALIRQQRLQQQQLQQQLPMDGE